MNTGEKEKAAQTIRAPLVMQRSQAHDTVTSHKAVAATRTVTLDRK